MQPQHTEHQQDCLSANAEVPALSADDRQAVLHVAVSSIAGAAVDPDRSAPSLQLEQFSATLRQPKATFVTLHRRGQLRGCRGSITTSEPLIVNVAHSARAAAFFDERFEPISQGETGDLEVHVSILGAPRPLLVSTEIELLTALQTSRDGLILRAESRQSLFLPSMWKKLPDPREFVARLKVKAGLPVAYWSSTIQWEQFPVEEIAGRSADFLSAE